MASWTLDELTDFASRIRRSTKKLEEPSDTVGKNFRSLLSLPMAAVTGLGTLAEETGETIANLALLPGSAVGAVATELTDDAHTGAAAGTIANLFNPLAWPTMLYRSATLPDDRRFAMAGVLDTAPFIEGKPTPESREEALQVIKEPFPAIGSAIESVGRTGYRLTNWGEYGKQWEQGTLFPAILEDVFNVATLGKGFGRGTSMLSKALPESEAAAKLASAGERVYAVSEAVQSAPGRAIGSVFKPGEWARRAAVQGIGAAPVEPETVRLATLGDEAAAEQLTKPLRGPARTVGRLLANVWGRTSLDKAATRNVRGLLLTLPGARAAELIDEQLIRDFAKADPTVQEAAIAASAFPGDVLEVAKQNRAALQEWADSPEFVNAVATLNVSDEAFDRALNFLRGGDDPELARAVEAVNSVREAQRRVYVSGVGEAPEGLVQEPRAGVESPSLLDEKTYQTLKKKYRTTDFELFDMKADATGRIVPTSPIDGGAPDWSVMERVQTATNSANPAYLKRVVFEGEEPTLGLGQRNKERLEGARHLITRQNQLAYRVEGMTPWDVKAIRDALEASGKFSDATIDGLTRYWGYHNDPYRVLRRGLSGKALQGFNKADVIAVWATDERVANKIAGQLAERVRSVAREEPAFWSPSVRTAHQTLSRFNPEAPQSASKLLDTPRVDTLSSIAERMGDEHAPVTIASLPSLDPERTVTLSSSTKVRTGARVESEPLEAVRKAIVGMSQRFLSEEKQRIIGSAAVTPVEFAGSFPHGEAFLNDLARARATTELRRAALVERRPSALGDLPPPKVQLAEAVLNSEKPLTPRQVEAFFEDVGWDEGSRARLATFVAPEANRRQMWSVNPETLEITGTVDESSFLVPKSVVDAIRDVDVRPPESQALSTAHNLLDSSQRFWKGSTLMLRPAWNVGNFFGNLGMLAPYKGAVPAFFKELSRELRMRLGREVEPFTLEERAVSGQGLVEAAMPVSAAQKRGVGAESFGALTAVTSTPASRLMDEYRHGAVGAIGRAWDRAVQFGAEINTAMDDAAHRAALKHAMDSGLVGEDAIRMANQIAGDARNLSRFERDYVRRVVPFYPWVRHMIQLGNALLRNKPGLVATLGWLSQQSEIPPDVLPSWTEGALPIGGKFYRVPWNPFATTVQANPLLGGMGFGISPELQAAGAFMGLNIARGRDWQAAPGEPERGIIPALTAYWTQYPFIRLYQQSKWPGVALYDTGRPRFSYGAPVWGATSTKPEDLATSYLTGVSEINLDALRSSLVKATKAEIDEYRKRIRQRALEDAWRRRIR